MKRQVSLAVSERDEIQSSVLSSTNGQDIESQRLESYYFMVDAPIVMAANQPLMLEL